MNRTLPCLITVWSAIHERGAIRSPLSELPSLLPQKRAERPAPNRAAELLRSAVEPVLFELERCLARYAPSRVGVFLGSSTGGIDRTEQAYLNYLAKGTMPETYSLDLSHSHHSLLDEIRNALRIDGPGYVVSTACSSTAKALATAQRWLALGLLDAALVGGADSKSALTRMGFRSLNLVDPDGCRPFDATRRGLELGEGAAVLLLERKRSTENPAIYLRAVGESNDAYDLTAPDPDGRGAEQAMRRALEIADLSPSHVGYVNAHGTGTKQNDLSETRAIARVFGEGTPFSSTKSTTGHLLGTAGALEAVICIEALLQQAVPPNQKPRELDHDLACQPFLEQSAPGSLDAVLSNSFAFGGSNASVLLARNPGLISSQPSPSPIYLLAAHHSLHASSSPGASLLPARIRSRSSPLTHLVADLFAALLRENDALEPALVLGSAFGEMSTTLALLAQIAHDRLSPLRFPSSVHNASIGIITQLTQNRGYATALAAGANTTSQALADALVYLGCHGGEALALVADEEGPRALLGGETFPALGLGFRLVAAESVPSGAWAVVHGIVPSQEAQEPSIPDLFRNRLSPEAGPLDRAPAAFGLELAHRVLTEERLRAPLDYPIGPRWTLRLGPIVA